MSNKTNGVFLVLQQQPDKKQYTKQPVSKVFQYEFPGMPTRQQMTVDAPLHLRKAMLHYLLKCDVVDWNALHVTYECYMVPHTKYFMSSRLTLYWLNTPPGQMPLTLDDLAIEWATLFHT